jgi:predicted house-cleaning noncanonical NTP pyrophosphatase (MazG superfamily)
VIVRKFRFDKLVRDKIPVDQRRAGSVVEVRVLSDKEYIEALKQKIVEEGQEIDPDDREESIKELADLQEVIDCLALALGTDAATIAEIQTAKREKAGSFRDRQFVETVEVNESDPWVEYYVANASRYPEVLEGSD